MVAMSDANADRFLDITAQICPMTFVRTKLAIEQMAPGEVLEVRLTDGEPLINVPRSATELGHKILSSMPEEGATGIYRLRIAIT